VSVRWPLLGRDNELARIQTAVRELGCAVVYGDAGAGRTRLASEVLDRVAAEDHETIRIAATEAARSMPLGALAPLLPALGPTDVNPLLAARRTLAERAAARPLAVLVDDAHLLDDASAALVLQAVSERLVKVVVTVHRWRPAPDAITALWKEGHGERIDLAALDPPTIDDLVRAALGGPVDVMTLEHLRRHAEGLPLVLTELVEGSLASRTLREVDGVWVLEGGLLPSPRLADLVERRISLLDAAGRAALELLAFGEPLDIDVFESLAGKETAELLEWRSFARTSGQPGRVQVWLAHPLHGTVIRQMTGTVRRRNLLRLLADAVEATDARSASDLARIALWRLETGHRAEPGGLVVAARQAMIVHDLASVERLAGEACRHGGGAEAAYLLACAHLRRGEPHRAVTVLSDASLDVAGAPVWNAEIAAARAEALFRSGQVKEAIASCEAAEAATGDPVLRTRLGAQRGFYLLTTSDAAEALAAVAGAVTSGDDQLLAAAGTTAVPALQALGLTEDAVRLAEQVVATHANEWGRGSLVLGPEIAMAALCEARRAAGQLDDADALATTGYGEASARRMTPAMAVHASLLGFVAADRGRIRTAMRWFSTARDLMVASDASGRVVRVLAGLARVQALDGDVDAARATLDEALTTAAPGTWSAALAEARGLVLAAGGHRDEAARVLVAAAGDAIASHHVTDAVRCLHTLMLAGGATVARPLAAPLREGVQGVLLHGWLDHIDAAGRNDPAALAGVSERFERSGHHLWAAQASVDAAHLERLAGNARRASALLRRAATLAERCEQARAPWLVLHDTVDPLTRRERDVASLAATGRTNPEIAQTLHLSVRTVENHLYRVYAKLGVTGRQQLADTLAGRRYR
jgi:DNA-binding CsgD family transcriptional regulator